jgi:hypothetical protein
MCWMTYATDTGDRVGVIGKKPRAARNHAGMECGEGTSR